ncbi:MAG: hypothetical protein JW804_02035 [Sedimentisphaerales bacterium]|nr:hypothetical protein [Sedimentisphaerales bacterium]
MTLLLNNHIEIIIDCHRAFENHFSDVLKVAPSLTRKIVSYQGNKNEPFYRWYKYKEAFSSSLVEYLLFKYNIPKGTVFDPFAGIGTTLFTSSLLGYDSEGIELLPVGQEIIFNRILAQFDMKESDINILEKWKNETPWNSGINPQKLNYLRITQGAYPKTTERRIGQYLAELGRLNNDKVAKILLFALMCILESVSYTRKDGQYLRWDYRSGRGNGQNTFDKGKILSFNKAIKQKLEQIIYDIKNPRTGLLFSEELTSIGTIKVHRGSCLDILPQIDSNKFKTIITSPPYCNRYDYTRTYALEHALLGINEVELSNLRQTMLSCTVENKPKKLYDICVNYSKVDKIFENQKLLNLILDYLEKQKIDKKLNNNGIPRMIRGYFNEMAVVISECFRVLGNNGYMFMVNDNVRYAGVCIPVDLILSKIAEDIGFEIVNILISPQNKGNSSQQMGDYGRKAMRKCVYVWRKP